MTCFRPASLFLFWCLLALCSFSTSGCDKRPARAPENNSCSVLALTPALTEWTAEIFGEVEAKKCMIARVELANDPEWLAQLPSVGPYHHFNIEKVIALKPALVLAQDSMNQSEQILKLKSLGLNVLTLGPDRIETMDQSILALGRAVHKEKEANLLAEKWKAEISKLKKLGAEKASDRVFFQIQMSPFITAGGDSFISEAFSLIGFKNVFNELKGYPAVSVESILKKNPKFIYLFSMETTEELQKKEHLRVVEFWRKYPALMSNPAEQVRWVNSDLFARCTFHLLSALEELAKNMKNRVK